MKYCQSCGAPANDEDKFCGHCGTQFNVSTTHNPSTTGSDLFDDGSSESTTVESISFTSSSSTTPPPDSSAKPQEKNTGVKVLSFFFPVVGLILYFAWRKDQPIKAKAASKFALIGFIVSIAISIASSILRAIVSVALS